MAQLYYRYGTMNSGKTIEILKVAYNYEEQGKGVVIMTSALDTRDGVGYVSSRIGMKRPAIAIEETTDIFGYIRDLPEKPYCVLVDEAQFLKRHHVYDLARVVDELDIPVMAFGLKNDFRNELFEGSKYLLLLADKIEEIKTICQYCKKKATMVLRTHDGVPVYDGEQIQIGGNETYISVCRKHYFAPEINKENEKMNIYDQLQAVEDRYEELGELLSDPDVVSDTKRFMELSKEEASTRDTVTAYREYKQVLQNIVDAEEMIKESGGDADLEEMAKQELKDAKAEKEEYEEKIKILLLPKDPNDDKNIILEIRGAAGGDEAALFAGDLLTMYQKYAEAQGWRFEVMEASMNGVGGFKEVVAMVSGQSVYSKLKYESGAHRVQRVPVTESQGRVHTSTATVLVMPEVEEVEYDIDPKDLRVDIYHASGAGGQNVNKVATAVRIVHLPTNIKVEMQEERTQQKNREKAMKIIRARVADHFAQIAQDEQDAERKSTVGTGDRSERIRTYNFPQNRVTDHRIGLTLQKLDMILSGKLDEVVDALVLYDQTQKLEELNK